MSQLNLPHGKTFFLQNSDFFSGHTEHGVWLLNVSAYRRSKRRKSVKSVILVTDTPLWQPTLTINCNFHQFCINHAPRTTGNKHAADDWSVFSCFLNADKSEKVKYTDRAVRSLTCHTATGTHVPYRITQCYLPPDKGDISAFTPAEAGTRLSDPGGTKRLSWPSWVVTYRDGVPAWRRSPIPVLTGPGAR